MPFKKHDRQYDLVVWGATGFTGRRVAQHIAAHFPTNLRWAVAGRTESKVRGVAEDCAKLNPDRPQPDIETCSLTDEGLAALAKTTHILLSCVGPFALYGEPAYAACAHAGTHYFDITGEFPFTAAMIAKYEACAAASGALMFSQSALESAAPDLVTWVLAQKARETGQTGDVSIAVDINSVPSGGTIASVLSLLDVYSPSQASAAAAPFVTSPVRPARPRPSPSLLTRLTGLRSIAPLGRVTTSLTNSMDRVVVERSWGLHQSVPSLKAHSYGEGFTWAEYLSAPSALAGAAVHLGLGLGGLLLLLPPVRWVLKKLVTAPGSGPDDESARSDVIRYRAVAGGLGGVKPKAYCEAEYRGSMYIFSAVLIAQAALTILEDDPDLPGGCYTPACLGQGYVDRIADQGFHIEAKLLE